jgi:hypothetical protein
MAVVAEEVLITQLEPVVQVVVVLAPLFLVLEQQRQAPMGLVAEEEDRDKFRQ